ncbi:hypothetical protein M758_3G065100 [Ceratodon purpureus]|nr:hypothetical protein M758_3G065100 [Ceratodon purpureus]
MVAMVASAGVVGGVSLQGVVRGGGGGGGGVCSCSLSGGAEAWIGFRRRRNGGWRGCALVGSWGGLGVGVGGRFRVHGVRVKGLQRQGKGGGVARATGVEAGDVPASAEPVGGVENLVIIGSGPAGYTAAIYAARANLKPVVFEGYQVGGVRGGQLMTTTEVENFPGFPEGISGPELMDRMRAQAERWGAELRSEDVEFVDVQNRPFTVRSSDTEVKCHSIIIATGATAKRLGLPREHEFWSRGISACAICDGASPIFKGQELAVVGGGDTATEESLYLTKYAGHVHLLVRRDKLRASKAMQDRVLNNPNITVHFNTETVDIEADDKGQMGGLRLRDIVTGDERSLKVRGLFYGIGHSPNSQLLEGQIELDAAGYVVVEPGTTNTTVEGVYAAGDLQDYEWRQAVTAAGSGCMAALSVERYLVANDLLVEFHQPAQEEVKKKELTKEDIDQKFDISMTKHKGQYALRKLYHESPRVIGVLYTSPTCGPCRSLKPILNKVIDEYSNDVHFVEIDIEEDPEIAEAGGIMGTPTVQFFKNKQIIKYVIKWPFALFHHIGS